jgi:hypothetical protein
MYDVIADTLMRMGTPNDIMQKVYVDLIRHGDLKPYIGFYRDARAKGFFLHKNTCSTNYLGFT